jgi:hypothetical protein
VRRNSNNRPIGPNGNNRPLARCKAADTS